VREKTRWEFSTIPYLEIENDHLHSEFVHYCQWLIHNPIPRNWKEVNGKMVPPPNQGDGPVHIIMYSTLSKYLGRTIAGLQRKFPRHPDFVNLKKNKVPAWWSILRPKFEKDCERTQMKINSDFTYGGPKIRPLYLKNSSASASAFDSKIDRDFVTRIDLESVLKSLMHSATNTFAKEGPMQKRAMLAILYNAVGRSGEVKFVDTSNWMYDTRFEVTDILWQQSKTSSIQTMPMLVDKHHYSVCFYHSIGCYFAVEHGLARDGTLEEYSSFLFPNLHSVKDKQVAEKITLIIQSNLPSRCPQKLKKSFTGKSIRQAAITQILMDPYSTYTDCAGRSGHDSGTTIDSYEDKMNISIAIRGGKLLANYRADAEFRVPSIDCLPSAAVERMEEKLFIIHLPEFKPMGDLHPVLRTCMAVLIMHHNLVEQDLGSNNAIATTLKQAARAARITDNRFDIDTAPEVILCKWSDMIKAEFIRLNHSIPEVAADGSHLATVINQQSQIILSQHQMMTSIESKIDMLVRQKEEDKQRLSTYEEQMSKLHNQLSAMQKKNDVLENKNAKLGSPDATTEQSQRIDAAMYVPCGSGGGESSGGSGDGTTSKSVAPKRLAKIFEQGGGAIGAKKAKTGSTADVTIAELLSDLSSRGRLEHLEKWENINLHNNEFGQHQSVKNVLELCQYVCDDKEVQAIRKGRSHEKGDLFIIAGKIEHKAFLKMWDLEGVKNPEAKFSQNKTKGSQGKKMTYNAVGIRVKQYKQKLAESMVGVKHNSLKLMERPDKLV